MTLPLSFIEAEIMPWAKENQPVAYAKTLGVKTRPSAYRRYMQRLVEIRFDSDHEWDPPLRLLEDTGITAEYALPDGTVLTVSGRRAEGLRQMSWDLLAIIVDQEQPVHTLTAAMHELDLFVADTDREWPEEPWEVMAAQQEEQAASDPLCALCNKRKMAPGNMLCSRCRENAKSTQGSFI
jgi:hypothetical protein